MSGLRDIFLVLTTVAIAALMIYSLLTQKEIYPFAPYTMYSWRHYPNMKMFHVYLVSGTDRKEIDDLDVAPLDEARIKESLISSFESGKSEKEVQRDVRSKLKSLYEHCLANWHNQPNSKRYDSLVVTYESSRDLTELRAGKTSDVEIMASYLP